MAMTKEQIRESLRSRFSSFATKHRRATMVLGSGLKILEREAELAKIPRDDHQAMVREEMERAITRMEAEAKALHPVVPVLAAEGA